MRPGLFGIECETCAPAEGRRFLMLPFLGFGEGFCSAVPCLLFDNFKCLDRRG